MVFHLNIFAESSFCLFYIVFYVHVCNLYSKVAQMFSGKYLVPEQTCKVAWEITQVKFFLVTLLVTGWNVRKTHYAEHLWTVVAEENFVRGWTPELWLWGASKSSGRGWKLLQSLALLTPHDVDCSNTAYSLGTSGKRWIEF